MKSVYAKIVSSYLVFAMYVANIHSLKEKKGGDFMELGDLETEVRIYENLKQQNQNVLEILNGEFNNMDDSELTEG